MKQILEIQKFFKFVRERDKELDKHLLNNVFKK